MISSFDEKLIDTYDHFIFIKGMLSAYNFNYYEGMKDDDMGIEYYCDKYDGDTVFVASSVISPGLVDDCHSNGKSVGVFIAQMDVENQSLFQWFEKIGVDVVIADKPEITPSYFRKHSGGSFWKVFFTLILLGSLSYAAYYVYKNKEKL